jgi:hypothetical protein
MSTFNDLLTQLSALDNGLDETAEINYEQVFGDIKDKVDAIKLILDKWDGEAENLTENWLKPIKAKISALELKREKLKEYVKFCMEHEDISALNGHAFRLQIQKSPKKIIYKFVPDAQTFQAFPYFVQVSAVYQFDKDKIKNAIKEGMTLPFVDVEEGSHIRFFAGTK